MTAEATGRTRAQVIQDALQDIRCTVMWALSFGAGNNIAEKERALREVWNVLNAPEPAADAPPAPLTGICQSEGPHGLTICMLPLGHPGPCGWERCPSSWDDHPCMYPAGHGGLVHSHADGTTWPNDASPRPASARLTPTENGELSPCPFCGGRASIIAVSEPSNVGGYVVQCEGCEASTRVWFPVKDDVRVLLTQAWNRRASARLPGEPPRFTAEEWQRITAVRDELRRRVLRKQAAENPNTHTTADYNSALMSLALALSIDALNALDLVVERLSRAAQGGGTR